MVRDASNTYHLGLTHPPFAATLVAVYITSFA